MADCSHRHVEMAAEGRKISLLMDGVSLSIVSSDGA